MAKQTNIRFYHDQAKQVEPFGDWLILAGENAYQAYYGNKTENAPNGAGTGEMWRLIRTAYGLPLDRTPCLLDTKELPRMADLRLAPEEQRFIKIFKVGEIPTLAHGGDDFQTRLLMNLAENNPNIQAVEWLDEGLTSEDLTGYFKRIKEGKSAVAEALQETAPNRPLADEQDKRKPYIEIRTSGGIRGLFRVVPKYHHDTGELISETEHWLSDPVQVVGIGQSESEAFIVLQFTPEGQTKPMIEALPLAELGDREGWKRLRMRGLKIANSATLRTYLADYLQLSGDRTRWTITNATGWQNGAYILPNGELIGTPAEPTLFRSQSATANGYDVAGSVESWKREIGDNLTGNPFMLLGVAVAFSAPLLHLLNADPFGVHLFGGSTAGKTTIANIASSIYGNPDRTRLGWNATTLGLMNEASARNDGFLALDEIGQGASLKHVEQTAYALFNGVGKIQGAKEGGNRDLLRWRIMAFSTGELDVESYLAQGGIKIHAGQLVRLLNVPITQAKSYHAFKDGKAHADHLNQSAKQHYGAIGRAWIEWLSLAENRAELTACYDAIRAKWLNRLPDEASPQVQRVAGRFAVLETALTASAHLTGWHAEECAEAMTKAFNEWVNIYGLHSREEKQVIEQVNGWLLRNGARFIEYPFNPQQSEPKDTAGYKELANQTNGSGERFWVFPQVYIEDVINGFNEKQANEILANAGMLATSKERGYKYRKKLPRGIRGAKTIRCYVLELLDEEDDQDESE